MKIVWLIELNDDRDDSSSTTLFAIGAESTRSIIRCEVSNCRAGMSAIACRNAMGALTGASSFSSRLGVVVFMGSDILIPL
mgnify:CR=1 FL=1